MAWGQDRYQIRGLSVAVYAEWSEAKRDLFGEGVELFVLLACNSSFSFVETLDGSLKGTRNFPH